jgi:hypothetical protein
MMAATGVGGKDVLRTISARPGMARLLASNRKEDAE